MLSGETFDEEKLEHYRSENEVKIKRRNRKGKTSEIDLKQLVPEIDLEARDKIRMVILLKAGMTVRPGLVVKEIFKLQEETIRAARIVKTSATYS